MTRKLLGSLLLILAPVFLNADTHSVLVLIGPGHTASPACATGTCDGTADSTSGIVDISKVSGPIWVTAYCATGPCVGTINVNQRSAVNSTAATTPPMTTLISCTNPDATSGLCADGGSGLMYVVNTIKLQVQQTGTGGGTFGVILETVTVTP